MKFLPVVERELRVASRRGSTYLSRSLTGLLVIVAGIWIWIVARETPSAALSQALFWPLAGISMLYCLMAGVGVTADSLSEEKREGTLGLLFLTDLKGYDVVLGKLAATSLNAFYRLLAVLPVLAIPLLLGGLNPSELGRMALVLVNTLFFSLSAGLFASAVSRDSRKAAGLAFILILLLSAIPPLISVILAVRAETSPDISWLIPSPGFAFFQAREDLFTARPEPFWVSICSTHLAGWFCLGLASVILPRSWQDQGSSGGWATWREVWNRWSYGNAMERQAHRGRLLDVNPYFWVAARNRLKPIYVYLFLGAVGLLWIWLGWKHPETMFDLPLYSITALLLHGGIKIWVASEASRSLWEDRRGGSLELILSTPLGVSQILRGQLLALQRQFGWPVAIVLLVDFAMFIAGGRMYPSSEWMFTAVIGVILFLADIFTLAWVGMWMGMVSQKSNRAASGALMRVLVLPAVIYFALITFVSVAGPPGFHPEQSFWMVWLILRLLNNAFFFAWAKSNLHQRFRALATERFQGKVKRVWWWPFQKEKPAEMTPAWQGGG
jgi:ABC-type transport system involved in multi-copper enzyme maturation permease subunit